ncbi:MAG: integrase, partial [Candidatus Omnitrophota bacterium]
SACQVKNLREKRTDVRIPSTDQFHRFLEEAAKTQQSDQLVAWLYLRAWTGIRPGESLWLEWDDIDFEHDLIHIRSKAGNPLKHGAERKIDISPALREKLLELRARWEKRFQRRVLHNWVFYNPKKISERAKAFRGGFRTARENAGIPWFTSYGLRHYFVSMAVMQKVDYLTIMKWTGHHSSEMIDKVYGHLNAPHSKGEMAKLKIG